MDELLRQDRANIGFRNVPSNSSQLTLEEVGSFQKFGFLPELIGRFSRIISFPSLTAETLIKILVENVLPQFKNEFKGEGLELSVTDSALNHIIARSEKRGTGARGLQTELVAAVEKAAFETFMSKSGAEVIIDLRDGKLLSEVR
jgi:ATP-dependent Clp protease ATP-binding subunit ClpX